MGETNFTHCKSCKSLEIWSLGNAGIVHIAAACVLSIFIAFLSSITIIGIIITRKKISRNRMLFLILSISDLLVGSLAVPMWIYIMVELRRTGSVSRLSLHTYYFLSFFFPTVSGLAILIIALERYLCVAHRAIYTEYMTARTIKIMLAANFGISAVVGSLNVAGSWNDIVAITQTARALSFTLIALGLSAIIGVNVLLLRYVKATAIQTEQNCDSSSVQATVEVYKKSASNTVILISSVLLLCYIPQALTNVAFAFSPVTHSSKVSLIYRHVIVWCDLLAYANSGLNSLIYVARDKYILPHFRHYFLKKDGKP